MTFNRLLIIVSTIILAGQSVFAQQASSVARVTGVEVTYKSTYNGKPTPQEYRLLVNGKRAKIEVNSSETIYIDYDSMRYYNMAILPNNDTITVCTPFVYNANLTAIKTDTLLGWKCTVYRTIINSNTIDIWATENLGFNGTFQPQSGVPNGLVLKIVRNGNTVVQANMTNQTIGRSTIFPPSWGTIVDVVDYRYALQNKDVISIDVFSDNYVGFNGAKWPEDGFENADNQTVYTLGGGSVILRKVSLPTDINGRAIFVEVTQKAVKDAYDRTGSIFVIPNDKKQSFLDALSGQKGKGLASLPAFKPSPKDTASYPGIISTPTYDVPLELMRFFTPFGVGGYNHIKVKGQKWADSVLFKQDVTHLAAALRGDVWVAAYIGNWADKGHQLSMKIKYHPNGRRAAQNVGKRVVMPIFNTVNILEQNGQSYPVFFDKHKLKVKFYVEQTIVNPTLVYTSTGHGGWARGDEFNPKQNEISLDGKPVMTYTPWRDDCGSYRADNPASGNSANGLSSSDLSRSAWCPGRVTNPIYVQLTHNVSPGETFKLEKGWHTIEVAINQGIAEGTSISYWCISGAIVGSIE